MNARRVLVLSLEHSMRDLLGALAIAVVLATASVTMALRAAGPMTLGVPGRANAHVSTASDGSFVVVVWAGTEGGVTDISRWRGTNRAVARGVSRSPAAW
ncbi:MAG: hypothetical protein A3H97_11995 [Acidobacteria bacterium RIFCSPLOWO2_02_FULL_65_29]|nr:MAG: hypothetical protein A3H97_11995 [Acidobacteria bacterium RIFCSPLOWO2_02_FULL_65_29]